MHENERFIIVVILVIYAFAQVSLIRLGPPPVGELFARPAAADNAAPSRFEEPEFTMETQPYHFAD